MSKSIYAIHQHTIWYDTPIHNILKYKSEAAARKRFNEDKTLFQEPFVSKNESLIKFKSMVLAKHELKPNSNRFDPKGKVIAGLGYENHNGLHMPFKIGELNKGNPGPEHIIAEKGARVIAKE